MSNGLRAVIALNLIAAVLIWYLAYVIGGGFESGVFPPDQRVYELRLVPLQSRPTAVAARPAPRPRIETPTTEYPVDPAVRPWEYLPDGSVRFLDAR
jgi:hypothetical protein